MIEAIDGADAVVFSDYGEGHLSREIVEAALACPMVIADPKPENVGIFAGVNVHRAQRLRSRARDRNRDRRRRVAGAAGKTLLESPGLSARHDHAR